jgi:hypothetical protein
MSQLELQQDNRSAARQLPLKWWPQVAVFLLVIVELCWILPWFRMVMQVTSASPIWEAALVLGGIMLAVYGLGYAMEALRLMKNIQLAGFVVFLAGSLLLAENLLLQKPAFGAVDSLAKLDPGAVLVLFFVIWMWWRGLTLSQDVLRPTTAWRRFELGLLFFMAYLFIASQESFYRPGFGVFVLFLFSGLMAVVFARVSYVGINKGSSKNPFDLRWLSSVFGILGVTVTLAALVGSLLTGQYRLFLDFLANAIKFLIAVTIFILGIPGLLISFLITPIVPWLKVVLSKPLATLFPENANGLRYLVGPADQELIPLPVSFQTICFWALVLLLVLVLIARIRRTLQARRYSTTHEPELLLKRGEAREIIRKALQDALNGLAGRLRPARRLIAAARIRRIYAQLMDLSEELNYPRPESTTPYEFLPDLSELFTNQTEDLRMITEAYVRVRYGEFPESIAEIEAVESAWQRILIEGQRLKRLGARKLQTAEVKEIERGGI